MTETQIAVQEKIEAPEEWGKREEIAGLANRYVTMIPGKTLSMNAALALAQYTIATDTNPYRGEVYAYEDDDGKVVIIEGYKLLVRWSRRQCNFYERYEKLAGDEVVDGHAGYRCRILRADAVDDLATLHKAGVPDAYKIISQSATGVCKLNHRAPNGWTVAEVARKRALKNALNRAYGAPSPREIAAESWMVDDTLTIHEDWRGTEGMSTSEAEGNALYSARARQITAEPSNRSSQEDIDDLFGSEPQQIVDVEPENHNPQGEPKESVATPTETPPETESAAETDTAPTNGLDQLLEDVNARLAENTLELYASKANMVAMLKTIGFVGYNYADHATMVSQLIARKEPNGKAAGA